MSRVQSPILERLREQREAEQKVAETAAAVGGAIGVIGATAIIVGAAAIEGLVVSILWRWFAVPLGFPVIGIAHAIGLSMLVHMMASGISARKSDASTGRILWALFVAPFLILGIGWIVRGIAFGW